MKFPRTGSRVTTVVLDQNLPTGCPFDTIGDDADAAVGGTTQYLHKLYVIPSDSSIGCGWGGLGYVNSCGPGSSYCRSWVRSDGAQVSVPTHHYDLAIKSPQTLLLTLTFSCLCHCCAVCFSCLGTSSGTTWGRAMLQPGPTTICKPASTAITAGSWETRIYQLRWEWHGGIT